MTVPSQAEASCQFRSEFGYRFSRIIAAGALLLGHFHPQHLSLTSIKAQPATGANESNSTYYWDCLRLLCLQFRGRPVQV
jgi:hypothetical protein